MNIEIEKKDLQIFAARIIEQNWSMQCFFWLKHARFRRRALAEQVVQGEVFQRGVLPILCNLAKASVNVPDFQVFYRLEWPLELRT